MTLISSGTVTCYKGLSTAGTFLFGMYVIRPIVCVNTPYFSLRPWNLLSSTDFCRISLYNAIEAELEQIPEARFLIWSEVFPEDLRLLQHQIIVHYF